MENEEEERFRFLETINAVCTNEESKKKDKNLCILLNVQHSTVHVPFFSSMVNVFNFVFRSANGPRFEVTL